LWRYLKIAALPSRNLEVTPFRTHLADFLHFYRPVPTINHMLTKSDLASFRQCPRKLWLEHHRPDLVPQNDPILWRRANDGNIVGAKARELLGQNVIWPKPADDPAAAAAAAAAQLSANPTQPAVEVPMFLGYLSRLPYALNLTPAAHVGRAHTQDRRRRSCDGA